MIRYLLLFFLFLIRASIYGQTIHFIVFADTDDPKIGSNNLKTYTALMGSSGFGVDLAQHTGLSLKTYGYYGSNCRLSELDHVLQSIEVTKKDVVFFYFIGHGFNNRSNEFPSLIFGNANNPELVDASSQNLQVIYDRINALHPQLTIAIGEACNKERNSQPISINSGRAIDVMPANAWDSKRVKSLFNYSKGGIILCSSSRNQFSYSNAKGGWMSVSLLNSFQHYFISTHNSLLSWDQLLFNVSNTTERIAKENNQEQTPYFKTFITSIKEVQPEEKEKKSTTNTLEVICPPTKYYINETALSGINEDLPLLEEMYNSINTENAKLYAESYIEFYRNQKSFYERLDKVLFNYINNIPLKCKKELDKEIEWVKSDMIEINERYKTVYKYANKPQQLVLQARSELPSIITKLNNIILSFGDQ